MTSIEESFNSQKYKELYEKLKQDNETFLQKEKCYDEKISQLQNEIQNLHNWVGNAQYNLRMQHNQVQELQQQLNVQQTTNGVDVGKYEELQDMAARKSFKIMELEELVKNLTAREEAVLKENRYLQLVSQAESKKDQDLERLKDLNMFLQQQIEKLQKNIQDKTKKVEFLEGQVTEMQEQFETAEDEFSEMDQAMEEMASDKEENQRMIDELKQKLKKSRKTEAKNEKQLIELQNEIDDMHDNSVNLQQRMTNEMNRLVEEHQLEIAELEERNTKEMKENKNRIRKLEMTLSKNKTALEQQKGEWEEDKIEYSKVISILELKLTDANKLVEEKDIMIGQLRDEISTLKKTNSIEHTRMIEAEDKYKKFSKLMRSRESEEVKIHLGLDNLKEELAKKRNILRSGCFFKRHVECRKDLDIVDELFRCVERAFRSFA